LQAKLANDGIEAGVPERQGLAIGRDRQKRRPIQSRAGARKHRWRDVGSNHHARVSDEGKRHVGALPRSGGDVEDATSRFDGGSREHFRNEKPGPSTGPAIVCQRIDWLACLGMETGPETGAHDFPPLKECVEAESRFQTNELARN
jgi:hypothetical protein